mgnify:CR=1 FL=1
MGFPKEIYDKAAAVLSSRRQAAKEQSLRHRQEIYRLLPQIEQIDSQLRRIGMQTIQAVAGSPERLDTIIERLKQQSLGLQKQRDDLLEAAGLLEIYRDDGHVCKRCEDTGYIGSTKCECFQKLLREAAFDALGASHPQDCRFSNFSLDYYSPQPLANGVVPRQRMAQVKNFCSDYARDFFVERHSFSKAQSSPSLLFLGNTGLGKTHLSLAIAGQVINKGYGVIYGSAQNLLAKLEKEKFSFNNTEDQPQSYLSLVLECDLLILDIISSIPACWRADRPSSAPTFPFRRSASGTPIA